MGSAVDEVWNHVLAAVEHEPPRPQHPDVASVSGRMTSRYVDARTIHHTMP
jgi:hypothetical protein